MISHKSNLSKKQIRETWSNYIMQNHDQPTRDILIEHYLPLVNMAANQMRRKLRGCVDLGDLISSGTLGLMMALDAFDPSRDITFETYSYYRIRGAMLDEVRAMDWVPRRIRLLERDLLQARELLANALGHVPTGLELADHLGLPPEQVQQMVRECLPTHMQSLTTRFSSGGQDLKIGVDIDSISETNRELANWDTHQDLDENFLSKLGLAERQTVIHRYYDAMTYRQIGHELGLSESRARQIYLGAMNRLGLLAKRLSTRQWKPSRCFAAVRPACEVAA